jgi:hypothetical protein
MLCGEIVKEILDKKLIKEISEKQYFDENCDMAYSSACHAKAVYETYGDIITIGSGYEFLGPAKLIKFLPLAKGKTVEEKTTLLNDIKPLRGNDVNDRYLEMKGEKVEPCKCQAFEEKVIQVCKGCGKQKAEEGKARAKAYNLRTGSVMAGKGEGT